MPTKYQVFCDDMSGMTWCPALGGETIEECVSFIQNGVGSVIPSQHWMYHIYDLHSEKVRGGKKIDVYKYVKSVAGSECKKGGGCLDYALTIWEDSRLKKEGKWLFTDKIWDN